MKAAADISAAISRKPIRRRRGAACSRSRMPVPSPTRPKLPLSSRHSECGPKIMIASVFCPDAFVSPLAFEEAVVRALAEDLGRAGDVTSIATVPADLQGQAVVVARKSGVVAGLPAVALAFHKLAPDIEIKAHVRDGAQVAGGTALMSVHGNARAILGAERVALNLLGHLSGTATATHEFVRRIAHTRARFCCTL